MSIAVEAKGERLDHGLQANSKPEFGAVGQAGMMRCPTLEESHAENVSSKVGFTGRE